MVNCWRKRRDDLPGLVRGARAAEVLVGELAVVVAGDRQQRVELAVANRLRSRGRILGTRHAWAIRVLGVGISPARGR